MSYLDNKILWQCRRGLKEIDTILVTFAKKGLSSLNNKEKKILVELLDLEDTVLLSWFVYQQKPRNKYKEIIEKILSCYKEKNG